MRLRAGHLRQKISALATAFLFGTTGLNYGGCGPESAEPDELPTWVAPSDPNPDSDGATIVLGEIVSANQTIVATESGLDFGIEQQQLLLHLHSSANRPINYQINTNAPWLSAAPSSGTLSESATEILVQLDRPALKPGKNLATLTVTSAENDTLAIPISAEVEARYLQSGGLRTGAARLDFGDNQVALPMDLLNLGEVSLGCSLKPSAPWLKCEPASLDIQPLQIASAIVIVDRGGLSAGEFTAAVRVTTDQGDSLDVPVEIRVADGGVGTGGQGDLYLSHSALDLGTRLTQRSFLLRNQGDGVLDFTVTSDKEWVTLSGTPGSSSGEYKTITARVVRDGMAAGVYEATLSISSDRGNASVHLTMNVEGENGSGGNENDGTPILSVGTQSLDFGSTTTHRSFLVRNAGKGTLTYQISDDAAWAAAAPASGTNTGRYDAIEVTVNRGGLASGDYSGTLLVNGDNGESKTVSLKMKVAGGGGGNEAALEVVPTALDFKDDLKSQTFKLHRLNGQPVAYTIASGADWAKVTPSSGTLDLETDLISVTVERGALVIGAYQTELIITTDTGLSERVLLSLNKPVFEPRVVPWIEMNQYSDADLDHCVAGLKVWNRITDTVIVTTTPERASLYTKLRNRVPSMRIIPGVKTANRFINTGGFDALEAWQGTAEDVRTMMETSGEKRFVLENETALEGYYLGRWSIDWNKLGTGLAYLPADAEIVFYPSVVNRDDAVQRRSADLCEFVESQITSRFVDQSRAHPKWVNDPDWIQNRVTIDGISELELMPILYFGWFGDTLFYTYAQTPDAIRVTSESLGIVYPGFTRWQESAEEISARVDALR